MADDNGKSNNGGDNGKSNNGGDSSGGGASSGDTTALDKFLSMVGLVALIGCIGLFASVVGIPPTPETSAHSPTAPQTSPHSDGTQPQSIQVPPPRSGRVALVSGHAGYDSGAVCRKPDGQVTCTEADVVSTIAQETAQILRQAGYDTMVLEEYDPRLDGLQADVLLSLHADSCVPLSGYKAAYHEQSPTPMSGDRLLGCIDARYATVTGLAKHPDTVTHNMTEYHAFRKIDPRTPAAILEMGFLGGDGELLTQRPDVVAEGVAQGVFCFLDRPR